VKRFQDQVAIVTGGARGIGKACCLRFAAEGARVAALDLDATGATTTAAECSSLGNLSALGMRCNVADKESVEAAVQEVMKAWGRVDVLVAAAGIQASVPLVDVSLQEWQRVLDIDLTGVFLCNQAVAPIMMAQRAGSIVNISSMAGKTSWPATAQYSAAKSGVIGLTRSVAMELAPYGCNVNAVCPGNTLTEMVYEVARDVGSREGLTAEQWLARRASDCPMQRLGTPEEIAGVIAFLATPDAAYITGQAIEVDGGMVLS
jgi:NAD(P)-dependent dehydrogenase (short-subunit alcohol dehydrogenase family)